jgi:hypothetical protein
MARNLFLANPGNTARCLCAVHTIPRMGDCLLHWGPRTCSREKFCTYIYRTPNYVRMSLLIRTGHLKLCVIAALNRNLEWAARNSTASRLRMLQSTRQKCNLAHRTWTGNNGSEPRLSETPSSTAIGIRVVINWLIPDTPLHLANSCCRYYLMTDILTWMISKPELHTIKDDTSVSNTEGWKLDR